MSRRLGLLVTAVSLAGCDLSEPLICPGVYYSNSIHVFVVGRQTGLNAANGASGFTERRSVLIDNIIDRDPERVPLVPGLMNFEGVESLAATVGPGVYDVTVEKDGYRTWTHRNAVVKRGTCGPSGPTLTAEVAPL